MTNAEATELEIYISHDREMYFNYVQPYLIRLGKLHKEGDYSRDKACRGWKRIIEAGAKHYTKEHCSMGDKWHHIFTAEARQICIDTLERHYKAELDLGNYVE